MKLTITIKMDGTPFNEDECSETAKILEDLADEIKDLVVLDDGFMPKDLTDSMGNKVGRAKVTR